MMSLLTYLWIISTLVVAGIMCSDNCDFPDTVRCADKSKCIHSSDICNFMPDCKDHSDENPAFCQEWPRMTECRYGYIMCPSSESYILNYCITLSEACRKGCSVMPSVDTCKIITSKQLPPNRHDFGCVSDQIVDLLKLLSKSFSKTIDNSTGTACPSLYNTIGDTCVSSFIPARLTWDEAKLFCTSIGGDLLVVSDVSFLKEILDFFSTQKIVGDFWIGGKYEKKDGWFWVNDEEVPIGAPFWGLMQNLNHRTDGEDSTSPPYTILPKLNSEGRCISMASSFYYYFSDDLCLSRKSPLCLYTQDTPKSTDTLEPEEPPIIPMPAEPIS